MERKGKKRALAWALALTLCLSLLPGTALAAAEVTTTELPNGTVGEPYQFTLTAASTLPGVTDFTWRISMGALPNGLTLGENTGVISGTPEAAGDFDFAVSAADVEDESIPQMFRLTIQPSPSNVIINSHTAGGLETEVRALIAPDIIQRLTVVGEALNDADFAFLRENCPSLEQLNLLFTSTAEVPDGALDNSAAGAGGGLDNLASVMLPKTAAVIGAAAFRDCGQLRVDLSMVEQLGESAFAGCASLEIGYGVPNLKGPSLAAGVFDGCRRIVGITLPPTITSLGDNAFRNIPSLTLKLECDGVAAVGGRPFSGVSDLMVRVPEGRLAAYQADQAWADALPRGASLFPFPPSGEDVAGFALSFAEGEAPQTGGSKFEGDYHILYKGMTYLHPQGGRELLLAGGDGAVNLQIAYGSPVLTDARLRLTGDLAAVSLNLGTQDGPVSASAPSLPVSLALDGGGHVLWGIITVNKDSRLAVSGGLTVKRDITLYWNASLTASGPFVQAEGYSVYLSSGALLELRDQPSARWLPRLEYQDWGGADPDGQARAVFADGEFLVDQDGVTPISNPAPSGGDSGPSYYSRTLTDKTTGVKVEGRSIHESARLTVEAGGLHSAGDAGCDLLRSAQAGGHLLGAWDLSLSRGFRGSVTVSLPVEGRDGDTLTVAHCVDGSLTLSDVKVSGGFAAVETDGLSPFAVLDGVYTLAELEALARPGWENPFADVNESDWFYEAVAYVHQKGLMVGVTETAFGPDGPVTRAQVWTVLARLDGADTSGGAPWYAPAQAWAVRTSVSDGTNPDGPVTREQLVTMLYRYAQNAGMDVSVGGDTNILSYDDAFDVAEWAVPAFQWACGAGVVSGTSDITLSPQAGATRAQLAAVLMRFLENL